MGEKLADANEVRDTVLRRWDDICDLAHENRLNPFPFE